jgi:hypothetical protein
MVQAAQPTLMKRIASFLLVSRPLWGPPPPTRSWLSHIHLYSSTRRFPVESHLLLGCSHKIPNGASSAFDLSRCSTTTSNTILGLCSQGKACIAPRCTWILHWAWEHRLVELSQLPKHSSSFMGWYLSYILGWTHTKLGHAYIIIWSCRTVLSGFGSRRVLGAYL